MVAWTDKIRGTSRTARQLIGTPPKPTKNEVLGPEIIRTINRGRGRKPTQEEARTGLRKAEARKEEEVKQGRGENYGATGVLMLLRLLGKR
jgi:hypothetical protein